MMRVAGLAVAGLLLAGSASAQDVFFGTLEKDGGKLILSRCDLGDTRYELRDDSEDDAPVADWLKRDTVKPTQASVFGSVEEEGDTYILIVMAIDDVKPGVNCHLSDALDQMTLQR
ncbi:hypothetical protein [Asticcacaulis benevestitus]|uniref:Ig-like domain-containing protein n=1 Tax=Asticcacaulis benevestitus DSM 16100 = ATCC BAA-896 TaxID=1121022 RepID=V4RRT6_9CAUL|nr:hypothetical protein [Asticcacaulis benevestitus]ESQ93908.1 hypothetical protein ABENE_04265 [Asticcacaulis benevestitus DSM 16100 = ATCC BAA-896]